MNAVKVRGTIPVISRWLYRRDTGKAARLLAAGSIEAVRELAGVFVAAEDPASRTAAARALAGITEPRQALALCTECLLRDDPDLDGLLRDAPLLPPGPGERALFLFCTRRSAAPGRPYREEDLSLLAAGYAAAHPKIRSRACKSAKRDSTCGILARALAGPSSTQDAARWSYLEWEVVIRGLALEQQWDRLWLLVPHAPAPLALTAIAALHAAGWQPMGDARIAWDAVAPATVERWTFPVPVSGAPAPAAKPAGQVVRLSFSPDGSLLATGTTGGSVEVHRTITPGTVSSISLGDDTVRILAIPAGNTHLVTGTGERTVSCFRLDDNSLVWTREHKHPVTAVLPDPDGKRLFLGDRTGHLFILSLEDGRPIYSLHLCSSPVTCIARAGPVTACGHADGTVAILDAEKPDPLIVNGATSPVRSLAITPDGTGCVAIFEQGFPALFATETGERVRAFRGHAGTAAHGAHSPGGGWFAVANDEHTIRIWDQGSAAPAATIPLYSRQATALGAAPDGSVLFAGFHDGTVRVYGMPGARLLREFKAHKKAIGTCSVSPAGDRVATASWDGTTRVLRLPHCEALRTWDAHAGGIAALAGPAGTLIAPVTADGTGRLMDGKDGSVIRTIDLYTPAVRAAALSPDGSILAVAGADATLRFWDIRAGSLAGSCGRRSTSWRCCAFLPGGKSLVAGGWDGSLAIIHVPDGTIACTLNGHTSTVTCCALSPDGDHLITGSNDTTARIWMGPGYEAGAVIRDSRTEIGAVAVSPDGVRFAAGGSDGVIRLYCLPYGTPDCSIAGPPGTVTSLAFTEDGCLVVAGYDSGICAFFSVFEQRLIRTVPAHAGAVTGSIVLHGGRTLVTTGADGACRFRPLPHLPFPARASPVDIAAVEREEQQATRESTRAQWAFLHALLAARFRDEIGICMLPAGPGLYDIMVVG